MNYLGAPQARRRGTREAHLGELEKRLMELLWAADGPQTAIELRAGLDTGEPGANGKPYPAITTVLTVLSRLEKKQLVKRERDTRPHRYQPVRSQADYVADLMHEALSASGQRDAVLARFIGRVDPSEAETLRQLLSK
ncbi:BlaI/MecI/CopY family transcriptional regulator [Gulosibacter molinativorax]|uniref:BlaI/MecI/CopY family transcriptional regulator n=1 Tax=Gulosibacter molinativorax TaxID=256821 RepID=A0ABT7C8T0_9MICO|nr:BlaI/MecI/CopY family transcriptional regulator [Gulosibacter molinativorax]MDJ1371619.1 BlaI/MecI/CopY family transcriptional regulator [Gulosibacter molinativorax]